MGESRPQGAAWFGAGMHYLLSNVICAFRLQDFLERASLARPKPDFAIGKDGVVKLRSADRGAGRIRHPEIPAVGERARASGNERERRELVFSLPQIRPPKKRGPRQ